MAYGNFSIATVVGNRKTCQDFQNMKVLFADRACIVLGNFNVGGVLPLTVKIEIQGKLVLRK